MLDLISPFNWLHFGSVYPRKTDLICCEHGVTVSPVDLLNRVCRHTAGHVSSLIMNTQKSQHNLKYNIFIVVAIVEDSSAHYPRQFAVLTITAYLLIHIG